MKCIRCGEGHIGDCMLTNGVCVFCYYYLNSWDSNGKLITKEESRKAYLRIKRKSK